MRSLAERRPLHHGRGALALIGATLVLAGCASGPQGGASGRDGAPTSPPSNLGTLPDAEPRVEPIRRSGGTSKPYTVLGRSYMPITDDRPFRESGLASWYGTKFHSQSTASGEPYDMYAMTAAHKTLPLPSYVRVRNPANDREVIVRVNDRGPFHDGRVIDLSYAAALKLDLLRGVAPVEIERLTNEDIRTGAWRRGGETMQAAVPAAPPPPAPLVVTELPPMTPVTQPIDAPAGVAPAGFWVQLGAFRERDGAESLRARASRDLPTLAPLLRVFTDTDTHRLQAGPFGTREAASATVAQLRDALRMAAIVVERR